ncbi:tetratricopeptide repeat protein [Aliikangiella coralliicola]|uniref:Tetratricopeptide repeat protein n=2 Tax=Aliikangiella coralliicola TaxID=2592383 RepID=A0A545UBP1_9GAMM|nr:tetratricopeptide repeat protein [Aliikangiella coralliicola]
MAPHLYRSAVYSMTQIQHCHTLEFSCRRYFLVLCTSLFSCNLRPIQFTSIFENKMNNDYELDLVRSYMDRGQTDQAIDLLKKLLSSEPDSAICHGLLASCLVSKKRVYAAEYELKIALSLEPNYAYLYVVYAQISLLKNKINQVIEFCDEALALDPEEIDAILLKSEIYLLKNDNKNALNCIHQAASLAPDNVEVICAYGEFYLATGDVKKAYCYAEDALKNDPGSSDANLLMGEVQLKRGNIEEAMYHVRFVILQTPDSNRALSLLGNIKSRQNIFIGAWWRFNSWVATLGDMKASLVLISGYLFFNLLAQVVFDLGHQGVSSAISYAWLGLVIYTWVAIPYYHKILKKELQKFSFNNDF